MSLLQRQAEPSTPDWNCVCERLGLSPRERDVALGILDDEKELRIAQRLGISPHTVHSHTERLYQKLGVSSRVQLVVRLAQTRCEICPHRTGCPIASPAEDPTHERPPEG